MHLAQMLKEVLLYLGPLSLAKIHLLHVTSSKTRPSVVLFFLHVSEANDTQMNAEGLQESLSSNEK